MIAQLIKEFEGHRVKINMDKTGWQLTGEIVQVVLEFDAVIFKTGETISYIDCDEISILRPIKEETI